MDRRDFLKASAVLTGGFVMVNPLKDLLGDEKPVDLALVKNGLPAPMVRKAVELLGGMKRFVKAGNTVLVKPNMSWDRAPEYAANTNPKVAAEVVKMCFEAGAKKVIALDRTCQEARRCYLNSGVEKAMSDAGADVRFVRDRLFEKVDIPNGYVLDDWEFYRDALEADAYINLPILKTHAIAGLTMGFKNAMGLIGQNRGTIHWSFNRKIVDINRILKPQLTILDAVRFLKANGPSGGNLDDVVQMNTIVAGLDPVIIDAWGAKLAGHDRSKLEWIELAEKAGMGSADTDLNQPLEYVFM